MLKPYVVVVALSALVLPVIGAQLAVAAETSASGHAPAVMPQVTTSPVPSASPSGEDDMAGMEGMPGMNHAKPATTSKESASHAHSAEEIDSESRPVAALVGGFAAVNGGVLLIAATARRRDKRDSANPSRPARPAK